MICLPALCCIWLIFMVNVGKYTISGWYGVLWTFCWSIFCHFIEHEELFWYVEDVDYFWFLHDIHHGRLTWSMRTPGKDWKRKSSSKPSFSGSMLIFGGVPIRTVFWFQTVLISKSRHFGDKIHIIFTYAFDFQPDRFPMISQRINADVMNASGGKGVELFIQWKFDSWTEWFLSTQRSFHVCFTTPEQNGPFPPSQMFEPSTSFDYKTPRNPTICVVRRVPILSHHFEPTGFALKPFLTQRLGSEFGRPTTQPHS